MVPILSFDGAQTAAPSAGGFSLYELATLLAVVIVLRLVARPLKITAGWPALLLVSAGILTAASLNWSLVDGRGFPPIRSEAVAGSIVFGAIALLGAIALALRGWWFRRRVWLSEPERLGQERRPTSVAVTGIVILAVLGGYGAAAAIGTWVACLAAFFAGLAACTVGHLAWRTWAGAIGLLLIGEGVALVFFAFGWPLVVGLIVAAGYLHWLSKFWHQQLLDEVPWTTTGELIPWARGLAVLFAILVCGVLLQSPIPGTVQRSVTLGLGLALALLLFRDGLDHGRAYLKAAAWFVAGAVAVQGWALAADVSRGAAGWLLVDPAAEEPRLVAMAAFAFGPLLLALRRLLAGRAEGVTRSANLALLPLLVALDVLSLGGTRFVTLLGVVVLIVLELATNRPGGEALAENGLASSNP